MNYEDFSIRNAENPLVEKFSEEASEQLFGYVPNNEDWTPYYERSMELSPQEAYDVLIPLEDYSSAIEDEDVLTDIVDELLAAGSEGYDRLHNGNYLLVRK